MKPTSKRVAAPPSFRWQRLCVGMVVAGGLIAALLWLRRPIKPDLPPSAGATFGPSVPADSFGQPLSASLWPRQKIDPSGFSEVIASASNWQPNSTLEEISQRWGGTPERLVGQIDRQLAAEQSTPQQLVSLLGMKASFLVSAGKPEEAYAALKEARAAAEQSDGPIKQQVLSTLVYFQGLTGLRRGENENCILCRGESSCILPISAAAVHQHPEGSRLAIRHFTEYLQAFPDDLEVRWLLNVAHMTLGEHPAKVDPQFLITLEKYEHSDASFGKFRDIGHRVGLNRFNQAGGAILEDFDNDGRLDVAVSTFDCTQPMGLFRNQGDGRFVDATAAAGVTDQLGGLNCVQTDYNNDGRMDIYIARGAWLPAPIRPSLLRNDGEFRFTDVTDEAGLLYPANSNAAMWADYDNDGWLDVFVCCERQRNRLYRNLGNGTFEEVARAAGLTNGGPLFTKGCAWIDYDNDDFPDLFVNNLEGSAQLFHNNRDGTFRDVTQEMGIDGPVAGFSCWAWDYNNDGWLDLFATCYERTLADVVKGLLGQPHGMHSNRLFRNNAGQGFTDVTRDAGLDMVFATMGSNYGDFDNDGWLDMYLGTGDPDVATLVPNRMFRGLAGERFAEITGPAGVGHLQKGHGVACGDWDRDGNLDIFIQMGGAIAGDQYHNILFQNPGSKNSWLTLKLIGQKTNRAAIGARIKATTAGTQPLTLHRYVSSGSSFGANPLEQTIGLGSAKRIAVLEIHWPASGTTQVFRDLPVNQAIEVTENIETFRTLDWQQIPLPKDDAM